MLGICDYLMLGSNNIPFSLPDMRNSSNPW
jgi:hypothetical protein